MIGLLICVHVVDFCRDIFYGDASMFGTQSCLDEIVETISCMLRVPRNRLHIVSGAVVHHVNFTFFELN